MNGKRILNNLIILFLVINSLLYMVNHYQNAYRYELPISRIQNITRHYQDNGIKIHAILTRNYKPQPVATLSYTRNSAKARHEIATYFFGTQIAKVKRSSDPSSEKLHYTLGAETLTFDEKTVEYQNDQIDLSLEQPTRQEAERIARDLINRMGLTGKEMTYDIIGTSEGNAWQLEYFPLLNGMKVLEGSMQFNVYRSGVLNAKFSLSNIALVENSEREIVPIDLVLFMVEDEVIEQGYTKLSEVSLCYRRDMKEEKILVDKLIPVYILTFDTPDEVIFVNAFTNQRMV